MVLTGVRPFEPARDYCGNPRCATCGGAWEALPEGWYCAACDEMAHADEARVRLARLVTPMPAPFRRPRAIPLPKPAATRAGRRRRRRGGPPPTPIDPGQLRGGLG